MVAHPGVIACDTRSRSDSSVRGEHVATKIARYFARRDDLGPGPLLGHIDIPFFAQTLKYWISQKLDSAIS